MRARLKSNAPINALTVGDLQLGREWVHVPPALEGAIRYWAPIYGIEVDEQANTMEAREVEAAPTDPNPVPGAQEPESPRPPANSSPRRRGRR